MELNMKKEQFDKLVKPVLNQLDKGIIPWDKPWECEFEGGELSFGVQRSASTGKLYTGWNSIILQCIADEQGYQNRFWATYRQAQKLGAQVNKGEKGTTVFFWKKSNFVVGEPDCTSCKGAPVYSGEPCSNCEPQKKTSWIIKTYTVFNFEQCTFAEEIPAKFLPKKVKKTKPTDKRKIIKKAENLVEKYAKTLTGGLRHGGDRAFYVPTADRVQLPEREQFKSDSYYYRVAFHELTHSTGHKSRLDRFKDFKDHLFGSEDYSKEELVAELGACGLSSYLNIDPKVERENSISYLQSWSKALKDKPKEFIYASQQAFRAVNHILKVGS
tara:strand:+ start:1369 stop:2352 length:984 start_codon:yes stop_codon:yes gene_type:complete